MLTEHRSGDERPPAMRLRRAVPEFDFARNVASLRGPLRCRPRVAFTVEPLHERAARKCCTAKSSALAAQLGCTYDCAQLAAQRLSYGGKRRPLFALRRKTILYKTSCLSVGFRSSRGTSLEPDTLGKENLASTLRFAEVF